MEVKGLKHLPHRLVLNQSGFQKLLALAHDVPHEHYHIGGSSATNAHTLYMASAPENLVDDRMPMKKCKMVSVFT